MPDSRALSKFSDQFHPIHTLVSPPPPRFSIWDLRPVAAIALLAGVFLFVALAFTGSGPAEAQAPYPGHPGPVQNLKVVPGETSNQFIATWKPPTDDGGAVVGAYAIGLGTTEYDWELRNPKVDPYHILPVVSTTPLRAVVTVSGPGVPRYVAVIAINDKGFGESAIAGGTSRTPVATAKPGPVQNLSVTAASFTELTVAWDAPASDGGSAITGYTVEASATMEGTYTTTGVTHSPETALTASVAVPGNMTRWVQVRAVNSVGSGEWTTANGTSNAGVPGAVQSLSVEPGHDATLKVTWKAPSDDGGSAITGYKVEAKATGDETYSDTNVTHSPATALTATVTGVAVGETRWVRVWAVNAKGDGAWDTGTGSNIKTVPGKIRELRTYDHHGLLIWVHDRHIDWDNLGPVHSISDGGSPIIRYDIEYSGTKRASATLEAPEPVQSLFVGPGQGETLKVTWKTPRIDGGSPITKYEVEASATEDGTYRADNVSHSGTALTATVTGVAVGETRWVRVLALNAKGNSRLKLSVATATNTKTTPHVVQNLSVTAAAPDGETKLTVTWEAPVSDGGHAITVYNVEARDAEGTYSTANVAYKPTVNLLTATLTNLAAGATRFVRVRAVNSLGDGPWAMASGTTETLPGKVQNLCA